VHIPQTETRINAVSLQPYSLARVNAQIEALQELLQTEPPSVGALRRAQWCLMKLLDRRRQIVDHWSAPR